jgi:hypothetical protein
MASGDLEGAQLMKLGISSAAAPDASLEELLAACGRRGLRVLELRQGDAHGVSPDAGVARAGAVAATAHAAGVRIIGYRVTGVGNEALLARFAAALGTRVLVDGAEAVVGRLATARRLEAAGAASAVVVRGAAAKDEAGIVAGYGVAISWEAAPADLPGGDAAEGLLRHGDLLVHICLRGSGPEAVLHEGHGVGALMGRLALQRYSGPLVLAPASDRYRIAWQGWLGRRGGWGCGSKGGDAALIPLAASVTMTGDGE